MGWLEARAFAGPRDRGSYPFGVDGALTEEDLADASHERNCRRAGGTRSMRSHDRRRGSGLTNRLARDVPSQMSHPRGGVRELLADLRGRRAVGGTVAIALDRLRQ